MRTNHIASSLCVFSGADGIFLDDLAALQMLLGDAARLFALDRYISESVGIPVLLARDPGDCCILGIGYLTENIQLVTPKNKQQEKPSYK